MRTTFRLSKSLSDESFLHLVSLNPVAVFLLPDCTCISGDADPVLQQKAISWFQNNMSNQTLTKRITSSLYLEMVELVRDNLDVIDVFELCSNVGIKEWDLVRILDGVRYKDIPFQLSYRLRVKFKDEVQKLLL